MPAGGSPPPPPPPPATAAQKKPHAVAVSRCLKPYLTLLVAALVAWQCMATIALMLASEELQVDPLEQSFRAETAWQHLPREHPSGYLGGLLSPGQRLCSGSAEDTKGSWAVAPTARGEHHSRRHAIYDQVPWNVCGSRSSGGAEEHYTRRSGCQTLDLLDAMDALGDKTVHLAGDSLSWYSFISLRWARRRVLLQSSLGCGNRSLATAQLAAVGAVQAGGGHSAVRTALVGSQGMEGDFRIHIEWVNGARVVQTPTVG
jgi:hypothetical protein